MLVPFTGDDVRLANETIAAVEQLNRTIDHARKAGLHVRVGCVDLHSTTEGVISIVSVEVSRLLATT